MPQLRKVQTVKFTVDYEQSLFFLIVRLHRERSEKISTHEIWGRRRWGKASRRLLTLPRLTPAFASPYFFSSTLGEL